MHQLADIKTIHWCAPANSAHGECHLALQVHQLAQQVRVKEECIQEMTQKLEEREDALQLLEAQQGGPGSPGSSDTDDIAAAAHAATRLTDEEAEPRSGWLAACRDQLTCLGAGYLPASP